MYGEWHENRKVASVRQLEGAFKGVDEAGGDCLAIFGDEARGLSDAEDCLTVDAVAGPSERIFGPVVLISAVDAAVAHSQNTLYTRSLIDDNYVLSIIRRYTHLYMHIYAYLYAVCVGSGSVPYQHPLYGNTRRGVGTRKMSTYIRIYVCNCIR